MTIYSYIAAAPILGVLHTTKLTEKQPVHWSPNTTGADLMNIF